MSLRKNVLFPEPDGPAIIKAKYLFMSMLKGEGCPLLLTSKTFLIMLEVLFHLVFLN